MTDDSLLVARLFKRSTLPKRLAHSRDDTKVSCKMAEKAINTEMAENAIVSLLQHNKKEEWNVSKRHLKQDDRPITQHIVEGNLRYEVGRSNSQCNSNVNNDAWQCQE